MKRTTYQGLTLACAGREQRELSRRALWQQVPAQPPQPRYPGRRMRMLRWLAGAVGLVVLVMLWSVLAGCTVQVGCAAGPSRARVAVEGAGYADVQLGGEAELECRDANGIGWHFRAQDADGQVVSGVVCCAAQRGCEVRR